MDIAGTNTSDTAAMVGIAKIPQRYYTKIQNKTSKLEARLSKQSQKALTALEKQEQKLYTALHAIDSFKTKELMGNVTATYQSLQQKITDKTNALKAPLSGQYIASLDSMTGVLGFLKSKVSGSLPLGDDKGVLDGALKNVKGLTATLNQAEAIKKFIKEREGQLKTITAQYKNLPASITKNLQAYNKELYYYSQQLKEVKEALKDPAKIEATVLKYLHKVPAFKKWMAKNGQLAQIFGSGSSSTSASGASASLAGLQTNASVQQMVQSRIGGNINSSSPANRAGSAVINPQQFVNGQLQTAMNTLQQQRNTLQNNLRQRLGSITDRSSPLGGRLGGGGGGASTDVMPDFKPNGQKSKTFWKRLERGYNLQATQRRGQFPSVNDFGLSLGYKLNDKSVIGVGLAYKFGLGESFSKIKWTNEGIGLRAFVDIKWKGNLWISGGYEQNYWQRFNNLNSLRQVAWVQSGLIGISKKVKRGKKEAKASILYDFMQPKTGGLPVVFRWGSSL